MRKLLSSLAFAAIGLFAFASGPAEAACTFSTSGSTMTLTGDCTTDTTITIPNGFTLDGDGWTITAVDPAGDHFHGGVVENAGTTANVVDLTIVGSALSNTHCDGGADRLRGIFFDGASGSIIGNIVDDINQGAGSGCQEGNAIEARNPPFDGTHLGTKVVTISGNSITDYQKTGIVVNGDVDASIHSNVVTGISNTPAIAQNGIQVGFGATASAKRNTVGNNWFGGTGWFSTGILIFEAQDVTVQGNTVTDNQVGVAIEAWAWFGPDANDNKVIRNTITGSEVGVSVAALDFGGLTTRNVAANNNKVTNNTITAGSGADTGIIVFAGEVSGGTAYDAFAVNNKIINNKITGYDPAIDLDGDMASKVHANKVSPP